MNKLVQGIFFPVGEEIEPLPIAVGDHTNINALIGGHFDCVRRNFDPEELYEASGRPDDAEPFVCVGYVHDEGILLGLPLNKLATVVFGQQLYGDVVVVSGTSPTGEYDGENYDVPTWFGNAVHNGSLVEASEIVENLSEIASCLATAVREGMINRDEILMSILESAQGNEDARAIIAMLTMYGRLRKEGLIEKYVSEESNLPDDWEVTDDDIEEFFNKLGGN